MGLVILTLSSQAGAQTNWITTGLRSVTNHIEAYAQVGPVAVLPVRATATGILTGLTVRPGWTVQAGQSLAHLEGPEIQLQLSQSSNAVTRARAQFAAARKALVFQRQKLSSHLSTLQAVSDAENAVTAARADLADAQARLRAGHRMSVLKAPAAGTVLAVSAADGERVRIGDPILTLQPTHQLWLKAACYGAQARRIRVGMTGQFHPVGGGEPVAVKVCSVFGALGPDGAESVGLVAVQPGPGWLNGEYGSLTLDESVRSLVAVPTRALILDQGQWWVLVHTNRGDQRRRVTPGPTRGWETFIERGLEPGAEVVVENAYLRFHRSISRHYQPPD